MATTHYSRESVADHNRRIDQYVPVTKWKHLKSAFYAILFTALAFAAIYYNADPTTVYVTAVTSMLVVYGVEVKEVEIARLISITLSNGQSPPEEDNDR